MRKAAGKILLVVAGAAVGVVGTVAYFVRRLLSALRF